MTSGKVGMPKPASPSSVGLKLPAPNSKPADPTASKVGYSLAGTGNNFFEGDTNNVLGVNKLSLLRETSSLVEVSIPADDAEELDVLEGTVGPPSSSKWPNKISSPKKDKGGGRKRGWKPKKLLESVLGI